MQVIDRLITNISYYKNPFKQETIRLAKTLRGQKGIEIGGPSGVFGLKSFFPVYVYADQIDGVNFSNETVWEGKINSGQHYHYFSGHDNGFQYIDEASSLTTVPDNQYDFLLSCHSLEHIANPIKALKRWSEVIKPGGRICLILPDKNFTFDHNRPYTTLGHLIEDYNRDVDESDTTHFDEVIKLHDLSKDIHQSREQFEQRTRENFINRCVHHHVYSQALLTELLHYTGFDVQVNKTFQPFHLFVVGQKRK